MITCGTCGYRNTAGHIFCTKCGAKMDVESAALRQRTEERKSVFRARAIRFLLLDAVVLVVVVLVLALWPVSLDSEKGGDEHFLSAKAKIVMLDNGASQFETFSEAEVNAVLSDRMKKRLEEKNMSVDLRVRSNVVRVTIRGWLGPWNLGAFSVGPLPWSCGVTGTPLNENERFVFVANTCSMGHLPLFGALKERGLVLVADVFDGYKNMRVFMDRIASFELADGTVTIAMTPSSLP